MAEERKITQDAIMKALDWSYDKAINGGIPCMDTALELADSYLQKSGTLDEQVKSLIHWKNTKCATSGFTGMIAVKTIAHANPSTTTLPMHQ